HIDARIHLQAQGAISAECQVLNLFGFVRVDLRRTNMLRSAAGLGIQEWILIREIVKAALRNYLENRQDLVTENTNRQLPSRHKFFYQQFAVILGRIGNCRFKVLRLFYNINADGRALSWRLNHNRQLHARPLMRFDYFPFRRTYTMLAYLLFLSYFIIVQTDLFIFFAGF